MEKWKLLLFHIFCIRLSKSKEREIKIWSDFFFELVFTDADT